RFSHDKTPYKTHLGIWLWEGKRPRMECSGFYFHLEATRLMLGVGLYAFPKDLLESYRQSVVHPLHGPALNKAIAAVKKYKDYFIGEPHFKKIPRGYDTQHPNAAYLLFDGLYAGVEMSVPPELFSEQLVDLCFEHYKKMLPLHRWLLALTERR
ncbi:MAG: TIGR02453 family protein, partial [Desulfobacca sp.]|nr:TIGR02453 family protein [Desulfobacca sp.]